MAWTPAEMATRLHGKGDGEVSSISEGIGNTRGINPSLKTADGQTVGELAAASGNPDSAKKLLPLLGTLFF